MGPQLNCTIVRDLLPNYIEQLTAAETGESVEAHLQSCAECRRIYEDMKQEVKAPQVPENNMFRNYLKDLKYQYLTAALWGLSILAIAVCLLVNYAVSHNFSWSLIVSGSILFANAVIFGFLKAKRHRFVTALTIITVLVIPLLALIEWTANTYFLLRPVMWLWQLGIPLTGYWLTALWICVLLNLRLRVNFFVLVGLLALWSVPGNLFIRLITGTGTQEIALEQLGNILGGAVFIIFGIFWGKARRNTANVNHTARGGK